MTKEVPVPDQTIPLWTSEPLYEITSYLQTELKRCQPGDLVCFEAIDPDSSHLHYAGEWIEVEGTPCLYRSLKVWLDLAEQLDCRCLTPRPVEGREHFLRFCFRKLDLDDSWHRQHPASGDAEKYGVDSAFFRIHKLEEPSFLVDYLDCLDKLPLGPGARVLNAGINRGDEFAVFAKHMPALYESMSFVGIDHSASAIAYAQEHFPAPQFSFLEADLNRVEEMTALGRFDLIVSIGTLHSASLRSRDVFCALVQHFLKPDGHLILGFPNCRYIDHEVRYGAKMKNYSRPEMSLVLKEISFHKRYLQQHKFRVTLTGKHTWFLTAVRLAKK